jgi:hypothetical protein
MNTSRQLKDLINNKVKKLNLNPQVLLNRFFMERFLERISLSKYKNNFVLKGGILVSSIVGIDSRMTKDMDLAVQKLLEAAFGKYGLPKDFIEVFGYWKDGETIKPMKVE